MLEADERHSQSTQKYRESVAAEVFGNKLKEICGATGVGGDAPSRGDWGPSGVVGSRGRPGGRPRHEKHLLALGS